MKSLLIGLVCLNLFGANFVVESTHKLSNKELKNFKKIAKTESISKFTEYESDYFDRLYSVDNSSINLKTLSELSYISKVEKDFEAEFFEIKPNRKSKMLTKDMLFPLQWGLFNQKQIVSKKLITGSIKKTNGVDGFDIDWSRSIKKIEANLKRTPVVAVVDMGVDIDHPELKDQIFKNEIECDSDGRAVGATKEDKDNNNYPGDCFGWNFAATDPLYWQFPFDDKNHGTHIAGIIAAKKNNRLGVSGVSDKIKILPVRVTGAIDERSERDNILMKAPSKRIANGILYAVRRGVDVINLSLGWPKTMDTKFMRMVIAEAVSKNIVVVAAAGNNNTNASIYPCAYYDVICVGSIDNDGQMSKFSNYGGEVDILAPGDQIVSTAPTSFIPLKLNIQGYEILSGTSQAAPFVSAAAALLKGTYKDISNDEVMRRLYDSAKKKVNEKKSAHGLLQLSAAFDLDLQPSVKPIFKNLSELVFNGRDGGFNLVLNLKNLGANTENVNVKVLSDNSDLLFKNNSYDIPLLESGKSLSIKIEGRLSKRDIELKTKIEVVVGNDASGFKSYFHELSLAKDMFTAGNTTQLGFSFVNEKLPVAYLRDGKIFDNLRTIDELYSDGAFPSFYVKFQDKEKKSGITLHLFNKVDSTIAQSAKSFVNENAVKLIDVTKSDFNYDGKKDLLIKTVDKVGEEFFVNYAYRNMDMTPLVGEYSDIKLVPEVVNVNTKTLRFKKTHLTNGMTLATPVFTEIGALPVKDQDFDPWTKVDKSKALRVYSLELNQELKQFEVRSFYNLEFIKKIKNELKELNHENIAIEDANLEILGMKAQTLDDYNNDMIEVYFSYGIGFYRKNFLLQLTDSKQLAKVKELDDKVEGADLLSSIDTEYVTKRNDQNVFVKYLTNNKVRLVINSNGADDSFIFRLNQKDDLIQSFLSLFNSQTHYYSFFETLDNIVLTSVDKVTRLKTSSSRKTTKFSFLPGVSMNEAYYPVLLESNGEKVPALYVDGTRISGSHIYVNTVKDNKIYAPAHLSLFVPDHCTTKNPTLNEEGFFRYTLICASKNGYYLNLIDLKM